MGVDPGAEWGSGLTSTANNTLRRKHPDIDEGDADASDAFDPAVEWQGFASDDVSGLGEHPTAVPNTAPSIAAASASSEIWIIGSFIGQYVRAYVRKPEKYGRSVSYEI